MLNQRLPVWQIGFLGCIIIISLLVYRNMSTPTVYSSHYEGTSERPPSYSAWLRLSGPLSELMQNHITTIAAEYNTPPFPPHITLLTRGDPVKARNDAIAALEVGGWRLLSNKTVKVSATPVAVLGNKEELKWSQVIILPVTSLYHIRPNAHVSLIYDDEISVPKRLAQEKRVREICSQWGGSADLGPGSSGKAEIEVGVAGVEVWDTTSGYDVSRWRKVM